MSVQGGPGNSSDAHFTRGATRIPTGAEGHWPASDAESGKSMALEDDGTYSPEAEPVLAGGRIAHGYWIADRTGHLSAHVQVRQVGRMD